MNKITEQDVVWAVKTFFEANPDSTMTKGHIRHNYLWSCVMRELSAGQRRESPEDTRSDEELTMHLLRQLVDRDMGTLTEDGFYELNAINVELANVLVSAVRGDLQ